MRRVLIWTGPLITILLLVLAGFSYWLLGTTAGLRWALVTGTGMVGGEVSGVSGSVWRGLSLAHLRVAQNDLAVDVRDFRLQVDWLALRQRVVHVQELSASRLDLALGEPEPAPQDDGPFEMPALPVQIQLDRFSLGAFSLEQAGVPLDVAVADLAVRAHVDGAGGAVMLDSLRLGHQGIQADIDGDVRLTALAEPWPFVANVRAQVQTPEPQQDAMICARHYLPSLPAAPDAAPGDDCRLAVEMTAQGSLAAIQVALSGRGQGLRLDAQAALTPDADIPVHDAALDLVLPDNSALHARLDWLPTADGAAADGAPRDRIRVQLRTQDLDVAALAAAGLPSAVLSTQAALEVLVRDRAHPEQVRLDLDIDPGSIWNDAPLSGRLSLEARLPDFSDGAEAVDWMALQVPALDVDLQLGRNQLRLDGDWGAPDSRIGLDMQAPALATFWPGLPGGLTVQAQADGNLTQHAVSMTGRYVPPDSRDGALGQAPANLRLAAQGAWDGAWRGQLQALEATHAGLQLRVDGAPTVLFAPDAGPDAPLWTVGAAGIQLALDGRTLLAVRHAGSQGQAQGAIQTRGDIEKLVVDATLIEDVQKVMALAGVETPAAKRRAARGGVKTTRRARRDVRITMAMDWDVQYGTALAGRFGLRRLEGDVMVPADPPFRLGLQALDLDVTAKPAEGGSQVDAVLAVSSRRMGKIQAQARTRVLMPAGGAPQLAPDGVTLTVDAGIENLALLSLFTGDDMEFGGQLAAKLQARVRLDGSWDGKGTVTGQGIKVVRVDDGLRLLDGTLSARLDQDRFVLDKLEFPARLRTLPKERRTAEWLESAES